MKWIINKIREYVARLLNIHVFYNVVKAELQNQKKINKKLHKRIDTLHNRIVNLEKLKPGINLDQRIQRIESSMLQGMDIHTREPSWGVVCLRGRDNGRAYIQFFELPAFEDAHRFRDILRQFRRATIDAPPGIAPLMRDMIRRDGDRIGRNFG